MTTKADTSVKFGLSTIADAPVMRGQAGAMIELLDAVLVNGYCIRTADSVVVASEVATVSISAGVPYPEHAVIALSGASVSALNDEWRIHSVTGSSFKFNCPGIADGTATGTISVKMAPAGWVKAFEGTNLAAYRSADPASTGVYLWVDDSDARYPRVRGYEDMTAIDAGTNPFPTFAQAALGAYNWIKSSTTDTASRPWAFVGDTRMIYPMIAAHPSNYEGIYSLVRFGDLVAFNPADPWACEIIASTTTSINAPGQNMEASYAVGSHASASRPRGLDGLYSPAPRQSLSAVPSLNSGGPTPADTQLLAEVFPTNSSLSNEPVRGKVPGLLWSYGTTTTLFSTQTVEVADGRVLFFVRAGHQTVTSNPRHVAYDLGVTGGWR
jgi:hypothetical protein